MEMNREKIYHLIDALLEYAKRNLDLPKKNVDYARNGIFRLFGLDAYPESVVEIVDWAGTVIRIVSKSRSDIEEIGERVREKWVSYENRALGIVPEDEKGVHNAISPTAVRTTRGYEMSIILRSNIMSEESSDEVFHAHPDT